MSVHRRGMHGRGHGMHAPPPDTSRYSDTVNERAVRILLECILVNISLHKKNTYGNNAEESKVIQNFIPGKVG